MKRILPLLFVLFVSCRTVEYKTVEVPVVHVEERIDTIRDSVHRVDSVYVFQKGDTVFSEKYRYITKWKDKIKIINTTDTVTNLVEKPVMVEKNLSAWQRLRMTLGGWLLGLLPVVAIYIIWTIRKIKI